jgi:hypothetical protein
MADKPTAEKGFQDAVEKTVKETHALGLPIFQARDGWVYAIYPDGRRVAVERAKPPMNLRSTTVHGRSRAADSRRA